MNKLSVVISAYNEEKKIEACLKSVQFADEIIFIDNTSADETVKIAKKYTDKVFIRENNPMLNVNKNFGFTKASHEWILNLDADEEVSPELAEEVKKTIAQESTVNGYLIPRKNIIFGKWIEHTNWYPDHQLRLFKKSKGKFEEKHIHELVTLTGEPGVLTKPLIHHNYETISQFIYKLNMLYAPSEAQSLLEKGYTFSWIDVIRFPSQEFLRRYFAGKGYKDGLHGLVLSLLQAFYHLVVFVHLWEKQGYQEVSEREIRSKISTELHTLKKEIRYWEDKKLLDEEKSVVKKSLLKLRSKFS